MLIYQRYGSELRWNLRYRMRIVPNEEGAVRN